MSVRIPVALAQRFSLAAELDGKSRSDATRLALEAYIATIARSEGAEARRGP